MKSVLNPAWALCLGLLAGGAWAADGLRAPAAETLWPQWQARLSLQAGVVSPLALTPLGDGAPTQRGVQGAALLGDYYFVTSSWLGGFRASGGLLVGSQGGVPLFNATAGGRWGLAVNSGGSALGYGPSDAGTAATYLGLGYTSPRWQHSGLALTADLGVAAERPGAAVGVGRALFGNQGSDQALREMRLSPMLQVGLRYSF